MDMLVGKIGKNSRNRVALLVLTVAFILSSFSFTHAFASEFNVYGKVQSFTWKEYNDNGSTLLKETGPIYRGGASYKFYPYRKLSSRTKAELFGGVVDYDGHRLDGVPVKTDTNYFGARIEQDLGWKFTVSEKSAVEPFVGIGYEGWLRNLKSTDEAIGLTEKWKSLYGRLGIGIEYLPNKNVKVFTGCGLKYPFTTSNYIDVLGVTVKPNGKVSGFAEVGIEYGLIRISGFYEGMRFSKSPVVSFDTDIGVVDVWQPKSKADMYGLTVGLVF